MHIFFSVGEPSGDQHAAHLIRELQRRHPGVEVSGLGGPLMEQAGCRLLYRLTDMAVMGLWRVIPLIWKFYQIVRMAERSFAERRPDAVVLIDFPGFNWWIAKRAKAAGIPVFYYLPPQLWAWAPWRIRKIRKYVDHVLSGLRFECDWYAERGVAAEYVGHPFFDEVADGPLDKEFCRRWADGPDRVVGILPGSRTHEVTKNWPLMLDVMRQVHAAHPNVRFLVANYRETHRQFCAASAAASHADLPLEFCVGKTPEIIATAQCCLMVSGSVSLEMLARGTPAVVLYRWSRLTYPIMPLFVHIWSMTLPNMIAGRRLYPEWLVTYRPRRDAQAMAAQLGRWLSDESERQRIVTEIVALRSEVAQRGATARAADAILARLPAAALKSAA